MKSKDKNSIDEIPQFHGITLEFKCDICKKTTDEFNSITVTARNWKHHYCADCFRKMWEYLETKVKK